MLTGWRRAGMTLVRDLRFRDFDEAKRFADRVADGAVDYDRRPDLVITYNRVTVVVANPNHAGVTLAERRLAAKVDAILAQYHPGVT
jgi:pterin-4a-carbinolamine dehydratase